ncbi:MULTISPECIES: lytic murein transglycosylase B [unclassified Halomonas]|uniref:lytic murein transglycosylase B n=1 Tax=unclassified Halomonas TaxID=2609666 RepID=UPI0028886EAD|nr:MULTISPECIES: lytic murein transglycosylase B [unclassified Halomonas]MDT0499379.1 lytic murein transglycosylase B [Halomonas sp. PAR7]MDT0510804.1 lytic murein transglycosylase B [Halomonas sp. LES1]MDT0591667.1 lytic murein transglycosylase B [Halomonas sp. PAR8]
MTSSCIHGRKKRLATVACAALLASSALAAQEFAPEHHDGARQLVNELVDEGIERAWLENAMQQANYRQEVLDAMSGAAERRLRWDEYRAIFLDDERIEAGVAFIEAHPEAFARAEAEYGVPEEIIAAILGVETRYGRITGKHRVLDSLSTLAFHHPRRGDFFRGELAAFLEIAYQQRVAPQEPQGSYAGAMGYPQFIPTSYRAYAVDFDDDGLRDLWNNPVDAIGSVANYFAEHGWQAGEPILYAAEGPAQPPEGIDFNRAARRPAVSAGALRQAGIKVPAALADERLLLPVALEEGEGNWRYMLGDVNFYVITRYNHSHLYAMAAMELAEAIAKARDLEAGWHQAVDVDDEEERR